MMTKDYKFFHGGINCEEALTDLKAIVLNDDLPALVKRIGRLERSNFAVLNFPYVSIELMVYALEDAIYGEYGIITYDGQFWTEVDEIPDVLGSINWEAEDINDEVETKMWYAVIRYATEHNINFFTPNK